MKFLFVMSMLASVFAHAELNKKNIIYGNGKFEGYISMPKNITKNTPAILLIHNWMGVSDETRYQADRFANLGYIVLAADVYGKGQRPKDATEAGKFAGKYKGDRKLFRKNLQTAFDFLKTQQHVDKNKLVTLGYCFGGTGAIELARSGVDVKGVISFHGGLDSPNPADGKNIKSSILIHHGEIDPYVPAQEIAAFEAELKNNNVKYELIKYPGAVHSFTDKGAGSDIKKGAAYNEQADIKSFAKSEVYLKEVFK